MRSLPRGNDSFERCDGLVVIPSVKCRKSRFLRACHCAFHLDGERLRHGEFGPLLIQPDDERGRTCCLSGRLERQHYLLRRPLRNRPERDRPADLRDARFPPRQGREERGRHTARLAGPLVLHACCYLRGITSAHAGSCSGKPDIEPGERDLSHSDFCCRLGGYGSRVSRHRDDDLPLPGLCVFGGRDNDLLRPYLPRLDIPQRIDTNDHYVLQLRPRRERDYRSVSRGGSAVGYAQRERASGIRIEPGRPVLPEEIRLHSQRRLPECECPGTD